MATLCCVSQTSKSSPKSCGLLRGKHLRLLARGQNLLNLILRKLRRFWARCAKRKACGCGRLTISTCGPWRHRHG